MTVLMVFGYRGNPNWRDMSEFVVHFTKRTNQFSEFEVLVQILRDQHLRAVTSFGAAKGLGYLGGSQRAVCFSEIPLDLLERLINRRSCCGLGFTKEFLVQHGGAPVWYLDAGGPVAAAFYQLHASKWERGIDRQDPYWKLTPYIDNPGEYAGIRYRFEWECEWRVAGPDGLRFEPSDVKFLFLVRGRPSLWPGADELYPCMIDPRWPMQRIQEAAAALGR